VVALICIGALALPIVIYFLTPKSWRDDADDTARLWAMKEEDERRRGE
jgi:hypothetical protein